jgi:hypothetical protein
MDGIYVAFPWSDHLEKHVTPSHLGVTSRDHVSWPAMKTMIPMMTMISVLHKKRPLGYLPPHATHIITPNQHGSSNDGGPSYCELH